MNKEKINMWEVFFEIPIIGDFTFIIIDCAIKIYGLIR